MAKIIGNSTRKAVSIKDTRFITQVKDYSRKAFIIGMLTDVNESYVTN